MSAIRYQFRHILMIIPLIIGAFNLTGCTVKSAEAFDKMVTFRDWDVYKTDVQYSIINSDLLVRDDHNPSMFPAIIADDNSYISFSVSFGDYSAGLRPLHMSTLSDDIQPFREFLQWAKQPIEEREKTKEALSNSPLFKTKNYRVANEMITQQPLFITTRNSDF